MIKRASILALAFAATVSTAQDTNFAVRISCDFQQQAGAAELPDLTLLQGSAPMIQAAPMRMGRAVSADSLTTCQLVFGPSATSTYYVATNAYLATNSAYYIQLGTIGTNSVPAGSNSPAAWWYSILFYRNGGIYWSGSGRLYIERTTATGTNGLTWQTWEAGAAKDDIARGWIADLSNVVDSIEVADAAYGTATNEAYRGDWGASVSNLAAQAAGWGDHAATNLLDLAGTRAMTGDNVTLARDVVSRDAAGAVAYGAAFGQGTRSLSYGAAFGHSTTASTYGASFGDEVISHPYAIAAGQGSTASNFGAAFGGYSKAGEYGAVFGRRGGGASGSFVFSDNNDILFNRTNFPNSFSLRAAGGIYAEIGTNVFAVSNAVTMNGVELGAGGGSGAVTSAPPVGVESAPLNYPWATNVTLLASTNPLAQKIVIEGWTTITPGAKSSVSNYAATILTVSAIGTNTVAWVTNGSSPILGYVATFSTNAETEWVWRSPPGTTNGYLSRIR